MPSPTVPVPEPSVPDHRDGVDLVIRDLTERADLQALLDVLAAVWPRPDGAPPLGAEVLRALAHAGGMVLGAFGAGGLVGGAVGFVGIPEPASDSPTGPVGPTRVHSHIVGVLPRAQGRSVGTRIKWHQRDWCLARGVTEMTWTFDPLVRRNTWLNLSRLGAEVTAYHEDFYGPMHDGVNAGLPTDRCVATWRLESTRVRAAAAGRVDPPTVADLITGGGVVVLEPDRDDRPRASHPDSAACRLVRGPADPADLRARDPDLVLRWRMALRKVLVSARSDGLRLTEVTRDGWYVLAERPTDHDREVAR